MVRRMDRAVTEKSIKQVQDMICRRNYQKEMRLERQVIEGTYAKLQEYETDVKVLSLIEAMLTHMRIYGNLETAVKRNVNI